MSLNKFKKNQIIYFWSQCYKTRNKQQGEHSLEQPKNQLKVGKEAIFKQMKSKYSIQNLRDAVKTILRGKFINGYINKQEIPQ